jgi:hypothetical protein
MIQGVGEFDSKDEISTVLHSSLEPSFWSESWRCLVSQGVRIVSECMADAAKESKR